MMIRCAAVPPSIVCTAPSSGNPLVQQCWPGNAVSGIYLGCFVGTVAQQTNCKLVNPLDCAKNSQPFGAFCPNKVQILSRYSGSASMKPGPKSGMIHSLLQCFFFSPEMFDGCDQSDSRFSTICGSRLIKAG